MSSKEEAFIEATFNSTSTLRTETDIWHSAMTIYARKLAIKFKEWQDENTEGKIWENYDGHDTWYNGFTKEVIETEELFERFLKQVKL